MCTNRLKLFSGHAHDRCPSVCRNQSAGGLQYPREPSSPDPLESRLHPADSTPSGQRRPRKAAVPLRNSRHPSSLIVRSTLSGPLLDALRSVSHAGPCNFRKKHACQHRERKCNQNRDLVTRFRKGASDERDSHCNDPRNARDEDTSAKIVSFGFVHFAHRSCH